MRIQHNRAELPGVIFLLLPLLARSMMVLACAGTHRTPTARGLTAPMAFAVDAECLPTLSEDLSTQFQLSPKERRQTAGLKLSSTTRPFFDDRIYSRWCTELNMQTQATGAATWGQSLEEMVDGELDETDVVVMAEAVVQELPRRAREDEMTLTEMQNDIVDSLRADLLASFEPEPAVLEHDLDSDLDLMEIMENHAGRVMLSSVVPSSAGCYFCC